MTGLDLLVRVLVCGLAGWRLASLLVNEEGPWGIFERLRVAAGVPPRGPTPIAGLLPGILTCVWCASFYTAIPIWFLWELSPMTDALIASWAVAILVERSVR